MAECKDCLHEKVCKFADEKVSIATTVKETVHDCKDFKSTADVVEVKHGEWIDDGFGRGDMICSVCKEYPVTDEDGNPLSALYNWQPEYCPNCGAKMDGGSDT